MASAKSIIWSPEADQDLESTLEYLEQHWSLSVIQDFLHHLFNTLDWISLNPNTLIPLNKSDNIRKYVLSQHHTLYVEIFDSHINLLRIFDNRQNPTKLRV